MWWIFAAIGAILAQIGHLPPRLGGARAAVPVRPDRDHLPVRVHQIQRPEPAAQRFEHEVDFSVAWRDSEVRSALVLSLKVVRDDHRVLRLGQQLPEVNVVVVALLIFTVIPVYFAARLTGSGAVSRGSTAAELTAA
jgi:hypothetical protein